MNEINSFFLSIDSNRFSKYFLLLYLGAAHRYLSLIKLHALVRATEIELHVFPRRHCQESRISFEKPHFQYLISTVEVSFPSKFAQQQTAIEMA